MMRHTPIDCCERKNAALRTDEETDMSRPPPASLHEALAGKHLTPRMLSVLAAAAEEAEIRGHTYIGTEHALLGLLSEPHGIAGRVLEGLGAADAAASETRQLMDSDGYNGRSPGSRR